MTRVFIMNGSPRMDKGNTGLLLAHFMQGLIDAGAEVDLNYASRLRIHSCSCGSMYCWDENPGICCINDEMQSVYPRLAAADILVLATPVYIPLPGKMQDFINRLCPLMLPHLENRGGRTRARMRDHISIRKIVLVATGGWWELENFDTLLRIVRELAADASVEFGGAVLRPHAYRMKSHAELTPDGESVLASVRQAAQSLINTGTMPPDVLASISRPLVSEEIFRQNANG
jgi:multimeric flavodoxin WrbA